MKTIKKDSKPSQHAVKFKTPRRYRLSIDNENTLNRVFTLRMSSKRIIILLVCALAFTILLGALLLGFTPLKTLLPGYLRSADRDAYISADNRIDSLIEVVEVNDLYINNFSTILSGDIDIDSLRTGAVPQTALIENTDSILAPSDSEMQFAREYERLTGISAAQIITAPNDAPVFVAPARNAVVKRGSKPENPVLQLRDSEANVYAIASATVVDAFRAPNGTFTMVLQHPDGFVSRYSGLDRMYYDRRQRVAAGSRIGLAAKPDGHAPEVSFELWRDGVALVPTSYINL